MRRVLAVTALAALAAIGAAAAPAGAARSCPLPDPPFTHWIDSAAPSAFNRLGLFRRHARASDRIPVRDPTTSPRTVGLLWLPTVYLGGIRRVRTSLPGGPYYAAPGLLRNPATRCPTRRLGLQIFGVGGASNVPTGLVELRSALDGSVGTAEASGPDAGPGPTFVSGLVPDQVVRVIARYPYRDARRVVGHVGDNLVWWRLAHHSASSSFPRSITWIGRGGKVLKVIHIGR